MNYKNDKTIWENIKRFVEWTEHPEVNDKLFVCFIVCIILILVAVWTGMLK